MNTETGEYAAHLSPDKGEKGVTTVEYAVMLVLVAIAVLAFGSGIAGSVTNVFSRLASSLA
jgi:Flp pilus assembly pilin Flp